MTIARIYQKIPLEIGAEILMKNEYNHYITHVLRAKIGDFITIFNGEGGEFLGKIIAISKKNTHILLQKFDAREAESPLKITLAQGIAKGERMDFIVQKAVELGVTSIVPLITERTNVRLADERLLKRMSHWKGVMVSACEQSGRNIIPQIFAPIRFENWVLQPNDTAKFVLSPAAKNSENSRFLPASGVTLLIGPEGGLSANEITLALNQGFMPLNLGPRILRTETATLAAITFFQCIEGDMCSAISGFLQKGMS